MKKFISLTLVLASAMLMLVSCEDKDEVADEIVTYYNDEWAPTNNMKQKKLSNLTDDLVEFEEEGQTDEAAKLFEDEMTPVIEEILKEFNSIDPPNKKVKKMNDMQIEAEEKAKELSKDSATYYESGDVSEQELKEPNREFKEQQEDILEYRDELMEEYDLEEVEDNTGNSRFPRIERAKE